MVSCDTIRNIGLRILANITCGNQDQISAVFYSPVFTKILELQNYMQYQAEAYQVIGHVLMNGSEGVLHALLNDNILESFLRELDTPNMNLLLQVLVMIYHI